MTNALAALFERYFADPVLFCADLLQPLREWQPQAAREIAANSRFALKKCRGAGGTHLLASLALWYHLTRQASVVALVAPVWSQLGHLQTTMRRLWETSRLPVLLPGWSFQQDQLLSPVAGWKVAGLSAESGERVEGLHSPPEAGVAVFFDEARGVSDEIYARLSQLTAGHSDFRIVAASTPGRPTGFFYEAFAKHADTWRSMTVSAADVPRLREHFERERSERGESDVLFRQQSAAEFAAPTESDSVFDFESVRLATLRRIVIHDEEVSPWQKMLEPVRPQIGVLGLDPAGRGRDRSIAAHRKGLNVLRLYDVGGRDEMATVANVARLATQLRVHRVTVDVGGLGSPMEARLRQILERPDRFEKVEVHPFNSAWRAQDGESYASAKAELAFRLRRALREGRISLPADPVLVSQMTGYSWQVDSRGRIRLIDPSPSPDRADALLVSFADPVISVQSVRVRGL